MNLTLLRVFLIFLSLSVFLGQSKLHLELVQVLMRHGERTPLFVELYPKDKHDQSVYEPWGFGQLTNQGKLTEYRIGTMLRERYNKFLSSIYYPRDIYAISSDTDRTKMSLQLALAGLYPPDAGQLWHPNLKWLAIPTHYIPERLDIVLKPYICPAYSAALREVRNMKQVRDKFTIYEDFFKFLNKKTGIKPEFLFKMYNLLTSQKSLNLTMPEWYSDKVYQTLQDINALQNEIYSYTTELKRLNGGMLIKKFIDNMNVKDKGENPRKMYIYSGHDINISAFAKAHNFSQPRLPEYGSTFILEKLRDKAGNLYVRILFWTGTTRRLMTMKLANCSKICPMNIYLKLVRDVIPTDKEMTCLWDNITKEELLQLFAERIHLN